MCKILYEDDNLLVADKPSGLPTHAPNPDKQGLVEILSQKLGIQLGVHQRLDAATSGVIAFSKSERGSKILAKAFELRNVKKVYRAIVCGHLPQKSGQWVHSLVHENGLTRESSSGRQAKSRFRVLCTIGPFSLLELDLLTGITHQLRVQCALAGCPILGDELYGGGCFASRLYLHAASLRLTDEPNLPTFRTALPRVFDKPGFDELVTPILQRAASQIPENSPEEAIRLLVPPVSGIPELIVEKISKTLLIRHIEPEHDSFWDVFLLKQFQALCRKIWNCKDFCYRVHPVFKKTSACARLEKAFPDSPPPFEAVENGLTYGFDLSSNATGLYLDQRENRLWIINHAHGRVLNLFAYTCAFSVCAASSDRVSSVTSVDAVSSVLQRGRENFNRNQLSTEGHRFITEDVFKYLAKCQRNSDKFDTIICDPPSFGRFQNKVFSIEKDLEELMEAVLSVAAPGAVILFCTNHRKIRISRLKSAWKQALRSAPNAPVAVEIQSENNQGPLCVGTDLKSIRAEF